MVTSRVPLAQQGWFTTVVIAGVMVVGLVAYLLTDSVLATFIASSPIGLICFFVVAPLADRRRARTAKREPDSSDG